MIDMSAMVGYVKQEVNSYDNYRHKCWECGERVFYVPADRAYAMGHIYTELGVQEFEISQICEFCFDEMFPE